MFEKWKSFWDRLFGPRRSIRQEQVLEYIAHRIDGGARLEEVIQEEYVRRMATTSELGRILTDPRIVGSARAGMRRDLGFEEMPPRRTSRVDRPDLMPNLGRLPEDGTSEWKSRAGTSGESQEA